MVRRRQLRTAFPLLALILIVTLFSSKKDYDPVTTDQKKASYLPFHISPSSHNSSASPPSSTEKSSSLPATSKAEPREVVYNCSLDLSSALNVSARAVAEMKSIKDFFEYVEHPTKKCRHLKTFGGTLAVNWYGVQKLTDGEKRVCLDSEYGLVQKRRIRISRRTRQRHLPKGLSSFLSFFSLVPPSNEPESLSPSPRSPPPFLSSTSSSSPPASSPGTCLVYSFGINNEWSFDSAMVSFGCSVYAFDPTMDKVKDKPKGVEFHQLGIGKKDKRKVMGNFLREVRRLGTLLEMLGHAKPNVTIDYLKIDTEGAELDFFEDVLNHSPHLLNQITQIGMEIHPQTYSKTREHVFKQYYKYFMQLENHGFKLIHSEENQIKENYYFLPELNRRVNGFYEMVWARQCL